MDRVRTVTFLFLCVLVTGCTNLDEWGEDKSSCGYDSSRPVSDCWDPAPPAAQKKQYVIKCPNGAIIDVMHERSGSYDYCKCAKSIYANRKECR